MADLDVVDGVAAAAGAAGDIYPSFDPETQAKLEDLFENAGFGNLRGDTKQLTDPEVDFKDEIFKFLDVLSNFFRC